MNFVCNNNFFSVNDIPFIYVFYFKEKQSYMVIDRLANRQ